MSLMEIFSDPSTFDTLSIGDKLIGSTVTMLMGMGITFCVLLILWAFVAIMGKAMEAGGKKKGDKASAAETKAAATPSVAAAPAASQDDVIAAVIAAAVAAYQAGGGTGRLVVRKISRISGETTAWTNAAREDCIDSRKF